MMDRDALLQNEDSILFVFDTFNDNQNAKWFGTTPAGMRFDQLGQDSTIDIRQKYL